MRQAEHAIARTAAQDQQSSMTSNSGNSSFPALAATRAASAARHSESGSEGFSSDNDLHADIDDDAVSNYSDDGYAPTEVTIMFNYMKLACCNRLQCMFIVANLHL
jgi:hypothetical protein